MRGVRESRVGAGLRLRGGPLRAARLQPARLSLLASVALVSLAACGPDERALALRQLQAPAPRQRAQAVRTLAKIGKPADDELWVAIERLTRDPAARVR